MEGTRVSELYRGFRQQGLRIWLDGGWGVDALLGEQTRSHADLDLVVEECQLARLVNYLSNLGFADVPADDQRPWNFVVGDEKGNLVDIHVINIDDDGNGIYGSKENGQAYPAQSLSGCGLISGIRVRCLSPEYQISNHSGYVLQDRDFQDVRKLSRKFGLAIPAACQPT